MKNNDGRRSFLKKITVGGIGAAVLPGSLLAGGKTPGEDKLQEHLTGTKKANSRKYNGPYVGENLNRVAMPIGGIGAGMFCMEGSGTISHMSVRNKPELFNEPPMFAAINVKGITKGAKVLEGPVPDWKKFGMPGSGNGSAGSLTGLPHFHNAEFTARFPFGVIDLKDRDIPLDVQITGWSPFIPTDEDDSSLPVGAFEYIFKNTGKETLDAVFSYNSKNFISQNEKNAIKKIDKGFVLSQQGSKEKPFLQGDFAIFTDSNDAIIDYSWFRGGWFDPVMMIWNTVKNGEIRNTAPIEAGATGASIFIPFKLKPGEEKSIRLMMAWYFPATDMRFGTEPVDEKDKCDPASGCCVSPEKYAEENPSPDYKPWYSSKFKDIDEVVNYWQKNYDDLHKKTKLFKDAFYASTLPPEVIEAVAANLSIIKSPTVLRQYNGRLWSFEGCGDNGGCCAGSCTHVWNYAQAISHLFPALERSLRNTEFCESQNSEGHQYFRSSLPIRPVKHDFYAASDGQLGGIMKVYREWRISADDKWLEEIYPRVQKSIDYCIRTWDPRNKGIVEEPHHNTYDIEFWGPEPMCTSFYLGALNAISKMGKHLHKDMSKYDDLYAKGKKYLETELYNGEYFFQKIEVSGLNAPNPAVASEKSFGGKYSDDAQKLLQKEGPKYQYGKGCLSDGIIGGWMSRVCGLGNPVDAEKTTAHLVSIHKYNFKKDLSEHANPQRPSYALGEEGGLILCTWPKGGKLSLPFVYSDEVWTGIEYQVASHLMLMGKVNEGLEIVRACRDRYDGRIRNPFNEYECGSWYARAMSSYAMLQGLTGVFYDAVENTLHIDSKVGDFKSFISTNTGFGTVTLKQGKPFLDVKYGKIAVKKVIVSGKEVTLG